MFEYAHEEPLLGEIAGHVMNRYLRFNKSKSLGSTRYDFRFGSTNPNKAQLYLRQYIDLHDEQMSNGRLKEKVFEQACEELLFKAFEAIDAMHKLDNNFFDRIKYVFKARS